MPFDIACSLTIAYYDKHSKSDDKPEDYVKIYKYFLQEVNLLFEEYGYFGDED
ncbi:hypothetical protein KAU45_07595 [bacterium]|jgi:hypothetical protein|nr:hypothetical protein [bacterium]